MKDYCDFLEKDSSKMEKDSSKSGLRDFLDEQGLLAAALGAKAYEIGSQLTRAKSGSWQYFPIHEFIKDAYGCPYVPGSSIKGMLRTALLSHIVSGRRAEYQAIYPERDVLDGEKRKRAGRQIEKKAFFVERPDPQDPETVNDIMRYLSVSDSEPLSTADLVLVKKYDKFAKADDGSHKHDMGRLSDDSFRKGNELNIYRECLKPGTRIIFTMGIDSRISQYPGLEAVDLKAILHESAEIYRELFLDAFDSTEGTGAQGSAESDGRCVYRTSEGIRCRNHAREGSRYCGVHVDRAEASGQEDTEELVCYLGGGVDFDSKTIMNALFYGDDTRLDRIARILYHQFPTKIDPQYFLGLGNDVRAAGFRPAEMRAQVRSDGSLKKGKNDHRHWRDGELGVSPHTLKLGKIGNEFYPMGKCRIDIEQL
jgi:CRISPR/Cas system CSM-associated protein Csm5 (group 7 of RAMP superfamily)